MLRPFHKHLSLAGAMLALGLIGCSKGPTLEVGLQSKHGHAQEDAKVLTSRLEALGFKAVSAEVKSPNELILRMRPPKEPAEDVDSVLSTITRPWRFDMAVVAEDQSPVRPGQDETALPAGVSLGEAPYDEGKIYVASTAEALQPVVASAKLPPDHDALIECSESAAGMGGAPGKRCMPLLTKKPVMSAISVKSAAPVLGYSGQPEVNITFNSEDARRFEAVTQENVGRQLAIIVDGRVLMAPRINEPIAGGQARITLGRTSASIDEQLQASNALARMLETGSLWGPWEKASIKQLP